MKTIFKLATWPLATARFLGRSLGSLLGLPIAALQACLLTGVLLITSLGLGPIAPALAQEATLSPRQVVEYALTLEKLEADFYQRAISAVESGRLNVPQAARPALVSYGEDEAQHVRDLSAVLTAIGGDPNAVTIPQNPNYNAILGRDPFASPADLLLAAQYVEDLGVAAYKGQVQNLLAAGNAADPILAGALEIHTVEARHAAGIRFLRESLLGANIRPWIKNPSEVIYRENRGGSAIPFQSEAFDGYATEEEVLALVGPILKVSETPARGRRAPTRPPANPPVPGLW